MDILNGSGVMPFVFVLALCASLLMELTALLVSGFCYAVYTGTSWLCWRIMQPHQ